jgi:hypothetical protein
MASSINASLTAGIVQTADTSGNLNLQSGGTTIVAITSSGATITGAVTGTSFGGALNGTLGATTPSTVAATTISASGTNAFISNTATGTTGKYIDIANTSGRSQFGVDNSSGTTFLLSGGVAYSSVITSVGANPVIIGVNQAKVATFDTSGNLGLGVTPSAWGSTYKAMQVGIGSSLAGVTNDVNLNLINNAYFNGTNWIYIANSPSERYRLFNGEHQWFNSASGTAGNAVSYTQAMTLDASGNIRLGTTSAGAIVPAMSIVRGGTTWQLGPSVPTGGGNTFYVLNSSNIGVYLTSGGTSWSASSDERLKTDLKPIENAAEKVSTLRSVTGRFKTDDEGVSRSFLIAQDVQAVLPEAVNVQDDEQGTLGVQYTDVIPLLVAAIKELKAEIDLLKGVK